MDIGMIIIIVILAIVVLVTLKKSVTVIRQAEKGIVERFGRFKETLDPGLRFLVPFADSLRGRIDMRETVLDIILNMRDEGATSTAASGGDGMMADRRRANNWTLGQ